MAEITKEQQEAYLANSDICPFCGSDHIRGEEPDFSGSLIWRKIGCDLCNHSWTEEFKLTNISTD